MGVRDGLCYMRSWTSQPAEPPGERQIGGVDTTSSSVGTSGTETLCADVDWPAQYTWAYHQYRKGYHGPYSWMGSLAFGMRDASGLHYRRNRFYDAEQGRFTQEDPIGLAGGINLYGYANGDPVTYSDPFGLCPKSAGGDGSTESYADCPPGTTGWYAYRLSSGAGNAALNYVGGTFAACGESWACQGVLALASLGASAAPTAARGGAARMAAVRLAGTQGETAVAAATGLVKNTSVRLGRRIPDFVEAGGRTFHEAKNVRSLSYTRQLREMVENLPEGGRLIIHVRQNTHVSRAFDALGDAVQIVRTIP
jgi:RHS repeat-associated protein